MALDIDEIVDLYRTAGAAQYGMEAVSQEQHALQCALQAEQAGADADLITAALLHDLGHLLAVRKRSGEGQNDLHEFVAIPFLRGVFGDPVLEPIRMHVDAKRFLCATESAYWDSLSPASQRSLALQGGPFTPQEAAQFIARPHASDAVALRRWDDRAKSPTRETPGWEHYEAVIRRCCVATS